MFRIRKAPLIAVIALASLFVSAPASAMVAGPRVVIRGGFYGPGWGWGWYGPAWYGPGWYGWWGPGYYYYGPVAGKVKIVTHDKDASVYVDGGYVGPVAKAKSLSLRPGNHDVELRDRSGNPRHDHRNSPRPRRLVRLTATHRAAALRGVAARRCISDLHSRVSRSGESGSCRLLLNTTSALASILLAGNAEG